MNENLLELLINYFHDVIVCFIKRVHQRTWEWSFISSKKRIPVSYRDIISLFNNQKSLSYLNKYIDLLSLFN